MAAFLNAVLPPFFSERGEFDVVVFGDKPTLLRDLPGRLRGLATWIPEDWRVVVLADEDRQDCLMLKARLEGAAAEAGLSTRRSNRDSFRVLNRIVVEELEAWIFGDPEALRAAYPRVSSTLERKAAYRDPDAILGGTWEALERELQRAGYYLGGIAKRQVAADVGRHAVPREIGRGAFRRFGPR